MKNVNLSILRDKNTSRKLFREASEELSFALAYETYEKLPKVNYRLNTPLAPFEGEKLLNSQVILPILRSGLAMLYPFMHIFPEAKVGFLGMRRDEISHDAKLYYDNLPPFKMSDDLIILDPMIATGGSASIALKILKEHKVNFKNIYYVGMVAAPEGLAVIKAHGIQTIIGAVDEKLNEQKFIVPGLGDFGDRYFGTES